MLKRKLTVLEAQLYVKRYSEDELALEARYIYYLTLAERRDRTRRRLRYCDDCGHMSGYQAPYCSNCGLQISSKQHCEQGSQL